MGLTGLKAPSNSLISVIKAEPMYLYASVTKAPTHSLITVIKAEPMYLYASVIKVPKQWHSNTYHIMTAICFLFCLPLFFYSLILRLFVVCTESDCGEVSGRAQSLTRNGHPSSWWPRPILLHLALESERFCSAPPTLLQWLPVKKGVWNKVQLCEDFKVSQSMKQPLT